MINKVECPKCHSKNDGHTEVHGRDSSPSDGDISLCFYCGTVAKYQITDDTISLAEFSEDELADIMSRPDIQYALALVRSNSGA